MESRTGIYVMQVASMLTGLHPQTLRKYERVGFLEPVRLRTCRMYSDRDIAQLRAIKYLVEEIGLNLAGVELALNIRTKVLDLKEELASARTNRGLKRSLAHLLDEILEMLGTENTGEKEANHVEAKELPQMWG